MKKSHILSSVVLLHSSHLIICFSEFKGRDVLPGLEPVVASYPPHRPCSSGACKHTPTYADVLANQQQMEKMSERKHSSSRIGPDEADTRGITQTVAASPGTLPRWSSFNGMHVKNDAIIAQLLADDMAQEAHADSSHAMAFYDEEWEDPAFFSPQRQETHTSPAAPTSYNPPASSSNNPPASFGNTPPASPTIEPLVLRTPVTANPIRDKKPDKILVDKAKSFPQRYPRKRHMLEYFKGCNKKLERSLLKTFQSLRYDTGSKKKPVVSKPERSENTGSLESEERAKINSVNAQDKAEPEIQTAPKESIVSQRSSSQAQGIEKVPFKISSPSHLPESLQHDETSEWENEADFVNSKGKEAPKEWENEANPVNSKGEGIAKPDIASSSNPSPSTSPDDPLKIARKIQENYDAIKRKNEIVPGTITPITPEEEERLRRIIAAEESEKKDHSSSSLQSPAPKTGENPKETPKENGHMPTGSEKESGSDTISKTPDHLEETGAVEREEEKQTLVDQKEESKDQALPNSSPKANSQKHHDIPSRIYKDVEKKLPKDDRFKNFKKAGRRLEKQKSSSSRSSSEGPTRSSKKKVPTSKHDGEKKDENVDRHEIPTYTSEPRELFTQISRVVNQDQHFHMPTYWSEHSIPSDTAISGTQKTVIPHVIKEYAHNSLEDLRESFSDLKRSISFGTPDANAHTDMMPIQPMGAEVSENYHIHVAVYAVIFGTLVSFPRIMSFIASHFK